MKIRQVEKEIFYPTLIEWCKGHNFPTLSKSILSDILYVAVNGEGVPTHSVCVYYTNSDLIWIGFPLSNPNLKYEDKKGRLGKLINDVMSQIRIKYPECFFYTTSSNTSLIETLENQCSFVKGDEGVTHLFNT